MVTGSFRLSGSAFCVNDGCETLELEIISPEIPSWCDPGSRTQKSRFNNFGHETFILQ